MLVLRRSSFDSSIGYLAFAYPTFPDDYLRQTLHVHKQIFRLLLALRRLPK